MDYSDHFGDYRVADIENIVVIENFIDSREISLIYDYCKSISNDKSLWESQSFSNTDSIHMEDKLLCQSIEIYEILQTKIKEVKKLVEFKFGRELEDARAGIRKWVVGESQGLHADGETRRGTPTDTYIVDYGSIMYLNDDYEGGEICFPAYEICFRPKPGTLIFFPSSIYYLHGVHEITSGERYTSAHFWVPTKHKKLIKMSTTTE
jgi:hypothetical protein